MYIKFCNFGPYADVKVSGEPKEEPRTDVYRRIHMYKWISALFTILSIVLLAVVFALAMKLSEVQSIQQCPETPEVKRSKDLNCTRQLCQSMYPQIQAAQHYGHLCPHCRRGWIMFEKTCYFKSKERLSWQQSSEECKKKGGHLAVIENEDVQKFLTEIGGLLYWIGLRYVEKQQWTWIDNTIPTKSYWANDQPNPDTQGGCAFLRGHTTEMSNWYSTPCEVVTQYICQKD
ncbi:C-type lectin domain family 4 member E-like isoform X2 [Silurus meridionalis]|uniref:C-type lectin domain family 4 member E-like isoform X2 n=1 Tax=Silurus meridionalis TaxID=175797 RepID=UPI001EEC76A3|nr:C-type lectin domain family 4 member E-like isoform X2 [Silurus meridionalis]